MDSALVTTAFPQYISEKRNLGWIKVIMSQVSFYEQVYRK